MKNKRLACLIAAFMLSVFGFSTTLYSLKNTRTVTATTSEAEKQIGVVEVVFSAVQVIGTLVSLILVMSNVSTNFSLSLFPLIFATIVLVFVFRKNEIQNSPNTPEANAQGNEQELQVSDLSFIYYYI